MTEANTSVSQTKSRGWCFTINNPTKVVLFPDGLPECVKYLVYQEECGELGTVHLQGYVLLSRPQRLSYVRKITSRDAEGEVFTVFERAHLTASRGTAEQNKAYCTKDAGRRDGPWELGTLPKQGSRTDLAEAAASLLKDGDIRSIDPAVFLKYASGCLKLAALAPPPMREDLKVFTLVGGTGLGKSFICHKMFPDLFVVNMGNCGLWWDGYTCQRAIMFEEFKGQVQLQKMLQILDPYPLRLEIKGGLFPARFTHVLITSNYPPDQWYRNEDGSRDNEMQALARRLDSANPASIPPRPSGPRYIQVDTRAALHTRLKMLITAGILVPDHNPWAEPPVPARAPTVMLSDEDEEAASVLASGPPRLRRCVSHITCDDAPACADVAVDETSGEMFVRDDILSTNERCAMRIFQGEKWTDSNGVIHQQSSSAPSP